MSWDAYVNDHLVGTQKVGAAAIVGHDGSVWAKKGLDKVGVLDSLLLKSESEIRSPQVRFKIW